MRAPSPAIHALCALLLATACAPTYAEPRVSVRVGGTPPDASVTVDDQPVGSLAKVSNKGLSVARGRHRITVERAGYFPFDKEFAADDGKITLDVKLERIPD